MSAKLTNRNRKIATIFPFKSAVRMVAGAFPIAKLGALLLRQLSKPIANYAKERAKNHPFFRKYVCMPPAQFYNWCEIKTKMWLMNLGKPVNIPPLNEAMAIELGANLLGEGILFAVAAAILIIEYSRQATKQAAKEQQQEDHMNRVMNQIKELSFQTERQDAQLRELFRRVLDLDSRVVKVPWTSTQSTPVEDESVTEVRLEDKNKGFLLRAISYVQDDLFRNSAKMQVKKSV